MSETSRMETNIDAPTVSGIIATTRFEIQEPLSRSAVRTTLENANPAEERKKLALANPSKRSLEEAQENLLNSLTDDGPSQIQINHLVKGLGLIRDKYMLSIQSEPNDKQQYLLYTSDGVPVIHQENHDFPFIPTADCLNVTLQARFASIVPIKRFDFEIV